MTETELRNNYRATSAATAYIIGFILNNLVYELIMKDLPDWMFKMSRESSKKGGAAKLRFRPTKDEKLMLKALGAHVVGTVEEVLAGNKNKGEAWEKYQVEKAGKVWKKDSTPYFVAGDLEVNGEQYQINFEQASYANEQAITKAMARA